MCAASRSCTELGSDQNGEPRADHADTPTVRRPIERLDRRATTAVSAAATAVVGPKTWRSMLLV
jgi:hypothetical protein